MMKEVTKIMVKVKEKTFKSNTDSAKCKVQCYDNNVFCDFFHKSR